MPDAQDHQSVAGDTIAKNVLCSEDLEHDLPILVMSCDWVPEVRVLFQHLSFRENFSGHDGSERRLTIVQKGGKAIEVGESSRRSTLIAHAKA